MINAVVQVGQQLILILIIWVGKTNFSLRLPREGEMRADVGMGT